MGFSASIMNGLTKDCGRRQGILCAASSILTILAAILLASDLMAQPKPDRPPTASFGPQTPQYRRQIEADWAKQEKRLGRKPEDAAAIGAALNRLNRLQADLKKTTDVGDLERAPASPSEALPATSERIGRLDPSERLELYHRIRWLCRQTVLENPRFQAQPILFMKRKRFVCQMLHEYLGYFYDYENIAGGGVYLLKHPGRSDEVSGLIQDRLPKGNYTTLAMSFDAQKVYFAFSERADKKPDFYSSERRSFHLYDMTASATWNYSTKT